MATDRKPVSAKARYAVMNRDGFKCQACGASAPNVTLQVDHKIPVSKGGTNDEENLRTLCVTCNLGKSDETPVEKAEPPKEDDKHTLIGWAFLSYRTPADGKPVVNEQGLIRDVFYSGNDKGQVALVDFFEWGMGEYTNSQLIPLADFTSNYGTPRFFKLFPTLKDMTEYYMWKYGNRSFDD